MATLEVRALARRFGPDNVALADVSFRVEDGRVAAILGPSGCGKTTALRVIAGLETPDAGDVLLDGVSILDVAPHRRGVGLMFQDLALFPHLDVHDNVDFGLRMQHWPAARREARTGELLNAVGLAERVHSRVHQLSGGEQQRVALARTLAPEPKVLLLDEPLGSLDEELKLSLRGELRRVLSEQRVTAILVSHDLRDAAAIADDLIVMERAQVLQAGPFAEVVSGPAHPAVARMLGYRQIARGVVRGDSIEANGHRLGDVPAGGLTDGASVEVFAHPSALVARPTYSGDGVLSARITVSQALGPTHQLTLDLAGEIFEAPWEGEGAPPATGELVAVVPRPGTLRAFEASSESDGRPQAR
jgi:ABC-type Fe3+/spermidine/putrescine transport system ATPase subunit